MDKLLLRRTTTKPFRVRMELNVLSKMKGYEPTSVVFGSNARSTEIGISRFRLFVRVWHSSLRFDLDNSLKTLLDCLQMVGAITDDKLCFQIEAEKRIDKYHPRVEFALLEVNEQKQIFH